MHQTITDKHLNTTTITMKSLSPSETEHIIYLLSSGLSATQVAKTTSHSKSVMRKIRSKHLPNLEKPIGGHPTLLSPANKRHARHLITSGKSETAAGVARALQDIINHPVSPNTVRRALREQGLKTVTKKKKALLSAKHGKARLDFANSHKDWTTDD